MLSSADLHLERALFLAVLIIFFGAGFLCTLISFIINFIQKKDKKGVYYLLIFLISGLIGVVLTAFYCYMILFEQAEIYMP
ncbi:TctA family transporter [Chryseobacterium bernardetii]|jgi:TctA family transporter|uniref:Uncharacterized protein n=3 Tax=Chryseobacterium TaxID=59732 RepID=A0A543EIR5_9FLAO|nr:MULTISPECIES: hypothetical protein [Chryseobacterium]TQM21470.1 hypothetical protein FB551_1158 [Chryseobacterium aquifrigidense]MDR6369906.1 TctA family transporter [Chryseobacterium vietnamense]MDR6440851.1 TctA family transporter [Chryseobacterium bernardetii]MDR6457934.1 TctA family transporter [Chryseobacterium vietnamense]MDR6486645.1 TctA family transporter [Chryseobacterium vietnamense]